MEAPWKPEYIQLQCQGISELIAGTNQEKGGKKHQKEVMEVTMMGVIKK